MSQAAWRQFLGVAILSMGEYGRAFEAARQGLHIAEEIEHRQWQTAAHAVLDGLACCCYRAGASM